MNNHFRQYYEFANNESISSIDLKNTHNIFVYHVRNKNNKYRTCVISFRSITMVDSKFIGYPLLISFKGNKILHERAIRNQIKQIIDPFITRKNWNPSIIISQDNKITGFVMDYDDKFIDLSENKSIKFYVGVPIPEFRTIEPMTHVSAINETNKRIDFGSIDNNIDLSWVVDICFKYCFIEDWDFEKYI